MESILNTLSLKTLVNVDSKYLLFDLLSSYNDYTPLLFVSGHDAITYIILEHVGPILVYEAEISLYIPFYGQLIIRQEEFIEMPELAIWRM